MAARALRALPCLLATALGARVRPHLVPAAASPLRGASASATLPVHGPVVRAPPSRPRPGFSQPQVPFTVALSAGFAFPQLLSLGSSPRVFRSQGTDAGAMPGFTQLRACGLQRGAKRVRQRATAVVARSAVAGPVEAPMRKMPLPTRFIGAGYFLVELGLGEGNLTLLLDSGFTGGVMLVKKAAKRLGVGGEEDEVVGLGATGNQAMQCVNLNGAFLRGTGGTAMPLGTLSGVLVDDFLQRKLGDEVGVPIDGMLGQGFLEHCDLEVDIEGGLFRAWPPGTLSSSQPGWSSLPVLQLPGKLQGVLFHIPGASEPIVGILDTGASHTVLNTKAAEVLRLDTESGPDEERRYINGIGFDNSKLSMPVLSVSDVTLAGAAHVMLAHQTSAGGFKTWSFGNMASPQDALAVSMGKPIEVGVGDIGFFQELLSFPQDSYGQFTGPVALLGQDLLAQYDLRLRAGAGPFCMKTEAVPVPPPAPPPAPAYVEFLD